MIYYQKSSLNEGANTNIKILNADTATGTSKNYITNLKYKNLNIELFNTSKSSQDSIDKKLERLSANKNTINKFDKYVDEEFKKLLSYAEEWDVKAKSVSDLKKLCTMDTVIFYVYGDTNSFEIWFNNIRKNSDERFFGGHSFVIDIKVKDGEIIETDSSLQG